MVWETITSRQNSLLRHVRKLLSSRSYRRQSGEYVCDGVKLLAEAVKWNAPVTTLICTDPEKIEAVPEFARLVQVPEDVMQSISPMQAPQGALFLVKLPETSLPERLEGRHYLVLDGVQDPGNVGTILRSADAFDCDGVLLLPGCADVYNEKTARATMGAVFRRPVHSCSVEELAALLERSDMPLYGTALQEDTVDLRQADLSRAAVAIGSEGQGLSREVLALCRKTMKIPMTERCESLNAAVAASVVLWEMYR